jgi:hypothetical protein
MARSGSGISAIFASSSGDEADQNSGPMAGHNRVEVSENGGLSF